MGWVAEMIRRGGHRRRRSTHEVTERGHVGDEQGLWDRDSNQSGRSP